MKTSTRKLTLSALFLALGLVLPLITGQIPQIGKMLLPMHIPVLLWRHGMRLAVWPGRWRGNAAAARAAVWHAGAVPHRHWHGV